VVAGGAYLVIDNSLDFFGPGKGGPGKKNYQEALDQTTKFRKKRVQWRKPAYGVYYDTGAFREFVDSFSKIVASENRANIGPSDTLQWVMGFYWMMTPDSADNNNSKNDFCIAPTLVSKKNPKVVKDYFSAKDSIWYNHAPITVRLIMAKHTLNPADGGGNAYDAGTLWP